MSQGKVPLSNALYAHKFQFVAFRELIKLNWARDKTKHGNLRVATYLFLLGTFSVNKFLLERRRFFSFAARCNFSFGNLTPKMLLAVFFPRKKGNTRLKTGEIVFVNFFYIFTKERIQH